jgi:CBS domain-containing protein
VDPTPVADIMTPVVFAVPLDMNADQVVAYMLSLHVHQLFVVDPSGLLVGVISALDILRHMKKQARG